MLSDWQRFVMVLILILLIALVCSGLYFILGPIIMGFVCLANICGFLKRLFVCLFNYCILKPMIKLQKIVNSNDVNYKNVEMSESSSVPPADQDMESGNASSKKEKIQERL